MTTIKTTFGAAGANSTPQGHGQPGLAETLRDIVDDLTALRTAITDITAKLDADAGDTGGDNDYNTKDPAALVSIKG